MPPHSFDSSLAWLRQETLQLPFEVGAATQRGRMKTMNNQDAIAIIVGATSIVAVVSDGCASSDPDLGNSEVGARLTSIVVAEEIAGHIARGSCRQLSVELSQIEAKVLDRLRSISGALGLADHAAGFVHNYLLSTVVAVAIDEEDTIVFGCGDGLYAFNSAVVVLPEQGEYLAQRLVSGGSVSSGQAGLQLHGQYKTSKARNVMIGTDGMQDLWDRCPAHLHKYLRRSEDARAKGYSHELLREFNRDIWFDPDVNAWACTQDGHDDRSFVVIRRLRRSRRRRVEHVADH